MSLREFFFKSACVCGVLLGLAVFLGRVQQEMFSLREIGTGIALAYNNLWLAFVFIRMGLDRSLRWFMLLIFGGMFFRMLLHFSLMFVLIGPFEFQAVPLFSSFVISYFLFMAFEVHFIHRSAVLLEEK